MPTSRQFEHLQARTLARIESHIPAGCPLVVTRFSAEQAHRDFRGFVVRGPGCEYVGRAAVVLAFVDGFVAAWRHGRGGE